MKASDLRWYVTIEAEYQGSVVADRRIERSDLAKGDAHKSFGTLGYDLAGLAEDMIQGLQRQKFLTTKKKRRMR